MADKPLTIVDDYSQSWHKKYGSPIKQRTRNSINPMQTYRSGLYSTRNHFEGSPLSTITKGTIQLPSLKQTPKLDPAPFRFTSKDAKERIANTMASNAMLDTQPNDVDKKAFNLRQRQQDKELAQSYFRTKSFSTVDKLNHMYENDNKILDCEILGPNAGTINAHVPFKAKKRLSMPQSTIKYHKIKEKQNKKELVLTPEFLELEKKKIIQKCERTGQPIPSTEQIHELIAAKLKKQNIENPDLGTRNYMLPSYHNKTHFKGATTLHLQCTPSLKVDIAELTERMKARGAKADNGQGSASILSDTGEKKIEPLEYTKQMLQNCGEYRFKDMKVIPTERGTGFMRKLSSIQSIDPARTFFGAGSKVATNLYGGTSKEILESSLINSKRHVALASQVGGNTQTNFQTSFMSFGGASKTGGFGIKPKGLAPPIFSNQNVSIQNLDLNARMKERAGHFQRISAAEILLGSKDETMTQEYEDLRQEQEFNQEIADDDSFFDSQIPMGQHPEIN